jgi:anti-sigma factor RsiW
MAEFDPTEEKALFEEKALLYVLGELPAEQAREFEAHMEKAPELMERVREIEEGAVALAMACPPKRPSNEVWKNIERTIGHDTKIVFHWEWFRNKGWAAAAACLIGWLVYALVKHPDAASAGIAENTTAKDGRNFADAARRGAKQEDAASMTDGANSGMRADELERRERARAAVAESEALRKQVAELRAQVASISQSLAQQQALLNDPARLKFVGLAPVSNGAAVSANGISPQLQRALALAMARELGWLGSSNQFFNGGGEEFSRQGTTNIGGVDFVDLPPGGATNGSGTLRVQSGTEGAGPSDPAPTASQDQPAGPPGLLPAFISGGHLTIALDNSVAAPGSQVTLLGGPTGESQQVIGTLTMSGNPTIVTIQSLGLLANGSVDTTGAFTPVGNVEGWTFTVNSWTTAGGSNQLQFVTLPGL